MIEDESRPLPEDPRLDAIVRFVVGLILTFGGGFLALEFVHWLTHGGFSKFLVGSAIALVIFFGFVIWSYALSRSGRLLRSRPAGFLLVGILIAGGVIGHSFMT